MALFKFIGVEELIDLGKTASLGAVTETLEALKVAAIAKTPELSGGLRGDYDTDGPHPTGSGVEGRVSTSQTGEGGPAIFVHQRTHLHHDVGQAKFLTAAVLEVAPTLTARVAAAARRVY